MPSTTPSVDLPNVLHVVPALFGAQGVLGGAERYVLELARHMADSVPTTLVSFGDEAREETVGRLRIRVLGNPWYVRGQRSNPVSSGLIREVMRATVVHCHQQHILASSLCAALGRITGRRVFVTDLGGGGWDISAYVSTDRWYRGHLHISEYSREVFGHRERPWAHVILGGIDVQKFSPDPAVERDGTVLFVGRLLPHKGVDDLVTAVGPDTPVELIGQPYDPRFQGELESLAHGKRVTFRADCTDADIVRAYRRAVCIVLPSVYRDRYGRETKVPELLGQTLLEGMSCGAAGVATRVASLPEVVEHGVSGFLVPPNDPPALGERIRWLLAHPAEARAMGARARARVLEKFTWPQVVERCLSLYGSAGRPAGPA